MSTPIHCERELIRCNPALQPASSIRRFWPASRTWTWSPKRLWMALSPGLHRSPDFGFSQEFAEYRAYTPGDDLRHVDWNVFARTERMYLKRYRGETNSPAHADARHQRVHGLQLARHHQARLRPLPGGFAGLSRQPAARRGGRDHFRRRRAQLRPALHAARPVHARGARHRERASSARAPISPSRSSIFSSSCGGAASWW